MNSLFGDFFREFWRGILGGVRDYLGEVSSGQIKGKKRIKNRKLFRTCKKKQ